MQNVDFNKPVKSRTIRNILIALTLLLFLIVGVGLYNNRLKKVGFIELDTRSEDTSKPQNTGGDSGTIIHQLNGDIIQGEGIKNVYNNK